MSMKKMGGEKMMGMMGGQKMMGGAKMCGGQKMYGGQKMMGMMGGQKMYGGKRGMTMKMMKKLMAKKRGGFAYALSQAQDYSAPGMLLTPAGEARALAGMNPEWKLATDPNAFSPKML
jgi:hypothetical protein